MLRRFGIRTKVLAVLIAPMLALLAAGGYISFAAWSKATTASAATGVVDVMNLWAPLGSALQVERTLSLSKTPDKAKIDAARAAVDQALTDVRPHVQKIDVSQFPPEVVDLLAQSQNADNVILPAARHLVDGGTNPAIIKNNYDKIITTEITLVDQIAKTMANRQLAGYVAAYYSLAQTGESLVTELTQGLSIIDTKASSPSAVRTFSTQTVTTELYRSQLRTYLTALNKPDVKLTSADPTSQYTRERNLLASGIPGATVGADGVQFEADIQSQLVYLDTVRVALLDEAGKVARADETAQRTTAFVTIGAALLAGGASLVIALLVSVGIVRPLKRLTAAAGEVRDQLPKLVEQVAVPGEGPGLELVQIPVDSSDEIGVLAAAFNAVNSTTLQVAQEQAALRGSIAEMFINVARRDQVLLNRQLSFIDSLERSEEDPNTLANLFRLDHLATRMRRNAESLLVLAGIDTGRRVRDAMPLSDVIRTASSEIEQYDRIELDLAVDPQMLGFHALGAAHLLAELFENATIFSEPETPVEVTTGAYGEHVVVQVLDHGLGMSDSELQAANLKIRSTSASDALGAQRLGLFVVGRIAHRLGAEVTLLKGRSGTGTITQVRFPITMFTTTEGALFGSSVTPSEAPAELGSRSSRVHDDAPLVELVDLTQLTDGATSLGLPRRRLRDDGADADAALPAAPALPQRATKTFDESKIVLPGLAEATLAPELSSDTGAWAPAIAASASNGLPTRSRSPKPAWTPDVDDAQSEVAPAAPPEARTALFSGFRTRGDLPAPAPADVVEPSHGVPSLGFVIPGLVPDDVPESNGASAAAWSPAWAAPVDEVVEAPFVEPEVVDEIVTSTDAWSPIEAWGDSPPLVGHAPAAYTEPTYAEPTYAEPTYAEPTYAEPTYAEPEPTAYVAPERHEAGHRAPEPDLTAYEPAPSAAFESAPAAAWETTSELWAPTTPVDDPMPTAAAPAAPAAAAPAPAAHVPPAHAPYSEFSAFSGYAGTEPDAAPEQRYAPVFSSDFAPIGFGPMLDEARAWNAGQQDDVIEQPAANAWGEQPAATPAWSPPVWGATTAPQMPTRVTAEPVEEWLTPEVEAQWGDPQPVARVEPVAPVAPAVVPDEPRPVRTPFFVDTNSPTQRLNPVEAELLAESGARADVRSQPEPIAPSWASVPPTASQTPAAFTELVKGDHRADSAKGRKRWNPFGRKKDDDTPALGSSIPEPSVYAQAFQQPPAPVPAPLVQPELGRSSAWSEQRAAMPTAADRNTSRPVATPVAPMPSRSSSVPSGQWSPPSEPVVALREPNAPQAQALSSFFRPSGTPRTPVAPSAPPSWSPPEWARGGVAPVPDAPSAPAPAPVPVQVRPSEAPRIGALDDAVAAMLALRSDIQEQALSELSQLSAYRPSAVNGMGNSSLTKRVPSTIPDALPIAEADADRGTNRDPDQLRSRLSSFQSGTSRGRRAAEEPTGPHNGARIHADE